MRKIHTDYNSNNIWIDRNDIKLYLNDIKNLDTLTRSEEFELIRRIQAGDDTARTKLILGNLRFVITVAKHYMLPNVAIEDLISEGNYGLIKAAHRIDVDCIIESKNKFISYAVHWIRQSIIDSLNKYSRLIRVPINVLSKLQKDKDGLTDDEYYELENDLGIPIVRSLNVPVNEDGDEMIDLIHCDTFDSPDNIILNTKNVKDEILKALSCLSERERDIIIRYFGLADGNDETLDMIAEDIGLTKERIRQLKENAIRKLRHNPSRLLPFF